MRSWRCRSVVECYPTLYKALDSIPIAAKNPKTTCVCDGYIQSFLLCKHSSLNSFPLFSVWEPRYNSSYWISKSCSFLFLKAWKPLLTDSSNPTDYWLKVCNSWLKQFTSCKVITSIVTCIIFLLTTERKRNLILSVPLQALHPPNL